MQKGGGMHMSKESAETPIHVEIRHLDKEKFYELEHQIMGLNHNVLNKYEGKDFGEREHDVKHLGNKYFEAGKHGEVFVAMKGDRVVGFIALKKLHGSPKTAQIEQIRLLSSAKSGRMLMSLLQQVKAALAEEQIFHTSIAVDKDAKHGLGKFGGEHWFDSAFSVAEEKDEERHEVHG